MSDDRRVQWSRPGSWRFEVETVRHPDGRAVERGYVVHPGSVVLVPLRGEEVLMLDQYRPALEARILELPAGTRGWEEPWLACAQRELREETGYRAGRFVEVGRIWPSPGLSDEEMALYLALELTPDPLPADFDEEIVVQTRPLPLLREMALDGRLQDAKSVVGILRAAAYLDGHSV